MESWAFFCADNGGELTRGFQATAEVARREAQETATRIGRPVEYIREDRLRMPEDADDDWEPPAGQVVEPE